MYGAVLSSLLLITLSLLKYYEQKPLWTIDSDLFNYYFTNKNYTELISIHPTYYGMYLLLAIVGLLDDLGSSLKGFRGPSILILSVSLLFVGSRIILVLFLLVFFSYAFKNIIIYFKKKRKVFFALVLIFISLTTFFMSFFKETYLFHRLTTESIWELSYEVGTSYNTSGKGDSRLARWTIARWITPPSNRFGSCLSTADLPSPP